MDQRPPKALVVDDEPSDLTTLRKAVESAGSGDIDLLVTDIAMSPIDGS